PHAYVNAGDAPGTLLVVCTPGGFEEYFRALDALARTGAPAEADVIRVSKEHGLDIIGPPITV
ncbi:MAG TPA: hypothetical protein PLJ47_08980, partial [Candidatus Hydrogenedentes bacterium]|nr:hypothetical protein [Candidatus Hydrogenedentota bacterium]